VPTGRFLVRGLRTKSDEAALERVLLGLGGVHACVASSRSRCVEVDFEDDVVSVAMIIAAAAAAGFEASLAG
jgi:hypothetical protein